MKTSQSEKRKPAERYLLVVGPPSSAQPKMESFLLRTMRRRPRKAVTV